jgi:hypothetical protein
MAVPSSQEPNALRLLQDGEPVHCTYFHDRQLVDVGCKYLREMVDPLWKQVSEENRSAEIENINENQ